MPRKPNTALIYAKVPAHLRSMRERAGLTQRVLAERLRKPQSWIARCERANRRVDVAEWMEWCIGCGVEPKDAVDDLITRRR
jgi:ribosome-binding protein aMBF1 (putative translation factor)